MKKLKCKKIRPGNYTNEITEVLDGFLEKDGNVKLRFGNYITVHSTYKHGVLYAIRHPGATRGNITVNSDGEITSIILDTEFYGKDAQATVEKYIGYQMLFEGD